MDRAAAAYADLKRLFARRHHLGQAKAILDWDARVLMPDGAAAARGETMAALSGLAHEMLLAPEVADWLDAAEAGAAHAADWDPVWDGANLARMRKARTVAEQVPGRLVEAIEAAANRTELLWRRARREDDFALLAPALEEMLGLQRELGQARGAALGLGVYDALLDQYEPGGRIDRIEPMFDALAAFLPDLVEAALAAQARRAPTAALAGPFPIAAQERLGRELMAAFGFAFDRGRLDVSLHPFCGGADDDVRITTRYREDDFAGALMGVLHETGHALYEQGLPARWRGQPVGEAAGLALHESQSLAVEMQIARGPAFLAFAAPKIRAAFGAAADDPAWSADALGARARTVARGLIRVDADEATYPAHVVLRTRLERAMLEGDLAVADLPGAWGEQMARLVGVRPADDRDGCLQDIHWPSGGWGYFPTYTLGAMAAAQLVEALRAATPDLDARIAAGDLAPLVDWLRREVHGRAASLSTDALLEAATGRPLSVEPFRRHLEARYLAAA